jgi:hypothetical protein
MAMPPGIGKHTTVGGIIVTAKVPHCDRKKFSGHFEVLIKPLQPGVVCYGNPLIPGSPPATRINWVKRPPWVVQFSRRTLL